MANTFSLEIDPLSSSNGWMRCWLVVDGQRHYLDASSVFPPFEGVLSFARALADNNLPREFFWDEEGHGAKFQALRISSQSLKFRLRINLNGKTIVNSEFDRMQIAKGLLESLRSVALDCPGAESEWMLPYFLIEDFERDLAEGFSKSSEGESIEVVHFVFSHFIAPGGSQAPTFTIWVGSNFTYSIPMDDILRYWLAWFDLLEKIKSGNLPVELAFQRESGDPPEFLSWFGIEIHLQFYAEAATDVNHFRLKIESLLIKPAQGSQILLDVIIDREQFVNAFVHAFKEFLETDYMAFRDTSETKVDLLLLPIDRLTP